MSQAAKSKTAETDLGGLSFEAALQRLESIVQRLEAGEVDLEESIRIYEEGVKIKAFCEKKLAEVQERVEKIVLAPDGTAKVEPTEIP